MTHYAKSPIMEALCEFRFKRDYSWDLTVPGLLYEEVRNVFPRKEMVSNTHFRFQSHNQGVSNDVLQNIPPLMRFLSKNGKSLMHLGPNLLSIHVLEPYPQWNIFRPLIIEGLDAYRRVTSPQGLYRVGLCYINRIAIPLTNPSQVIHVEDYLKAIPSVPEPIAQTFVNWFMNVSVDHTEDNGIMTIQTQPISFDDPLEMQFILKLDYVSKNIEHISLENVMNWIDKGHEYIDNDFEACITDKARSLFQMGGVG